MDSFEAVAQFTQILKSLTPSMQSLTKAAHFALKNYESEDYLIQAIMDAMTSATTELNTKSTLFQLIEVIMHESFNVSQQSKSHYSYPYIHNLKGALPQILLEVLPGSNNSSIHNAYNCLRNISKTCKVSSEEYETKYNSVGSLFTQTDWENVDANLPFPPVKIETEKENADPLIITWDLLIQKKKQSQYERLRLLKYQKHIEEPINEEDMLNFRSSENTEKAAELLLTKRQILSRMEDDRESHKRSKESLWVVNRPKDASFLTEDEFLVYYWNKFGPTDEEEEKTLMDSFSELNAVVAESYKDKQV